MTDEKQVLEGALHTLKTNNYPKIMFESWDPDTAERLQLQTDLFEFIKSIGYTIIKPAGCYELYLAEYISKG